MLSTLIIVFREVLEAMLVVGIATAAAREANIQTRWIYGGIGGGLIAAILVALFADFLSGSMQGMGQEVLNAGVLIAASMMMAWTAIWMGKHGREMSRKIRQSCQHVEGSGTAKMMLAMVVGLAVTREGSEVVLFLYGVAAAGDTGASAMLGGGAVGMLLGVVVALGLYQSLIHIPLRYVFLIVTCLIVLLSAGMASQGVAWLVMIDVLPAWGQPIWNSSGIISEHGILGQLLHALMGYDDRPSGMQALVFVCVLSITWLAIVKQKKAQAR
ncbi:MAG: FTR1 family protein, partial [Mariprofundus sp.]|nr:FTR1 family protein [Mariprofundus sp.]